ncbi:hypothetical protein DIPPA_31050 [Diplonema papillatum]|nr:hypothetical protein DIPPA_31050 [Diplonema papillatum]
MTQVVLCRPRLSRPKDCYVPAASASPLFACIPSSWIAGKVRRFSDTTGAAPPTPTPPPPLAEADVPGRLPASVESDRGNSLYTCARIVFSHTRCSKHPEAYQLGGVKLIEADGRLLDVKRVSVAEISEKNDAIEPGREENSDLPPGEGQPPGDAGTDSSTDEDRPRVPSHPQSLVEEDAHWEHRCGGGRPAVAVSLHLPQPSRICGYVFQTSPGRPQHDPASWSLDARGVDGVWAPLHRMAAYYSLPLARSTWARPFIFNDTSVLTEWLGEHLLQRASPRAEPRIVSTAELLAGKKYVLLLCLSNWMLAASVPAAVRDAVEFHRRHSSRLQFEVVLVSGDAAVDDFRALCQRLPFAAVLHSEADRRRDLEAACEFDGTPTAVLFNCEERVLSDLSPVLVADGALTWVCLPFRTSAAICPDTG